MIEFFASLRKIIALSISQAPLGIIALNAINKTLIPKVQSLLDNTQEGDRDRDELEELLKDYQKAGRLSEEDDLSNVAVRALNSVKGKYFFNENDIEEVTSAVYMNLLNPARAVSKSFDSFPIKQGPSKFMGWWYGMVDKDAKSESDKYIRKNKKYKSISVGDEETTMQIPDDALKPADLAKQNKKEKLQDELEELEVGKQFLKQHRKAFTRYMNSHFHKKSVHLEIFGRWLDKKIKGGSFKMGKDIFQPVIKKMQDTKGVKALKSGRLSEIWNKNLKPVMFNYVEDFGKKRTKDPSFEFSDRQRKRMFAGEVPSEVFLTACRTRMDNFVESKLGDSVDGRAAILAYIEFFEDELEYQVSSDNKRFGSLESKLAYEEYRRRFAEWMLRPMDNARSLISEGEK